MVTQCLFWDFGSIQFILMKRLLFSFFLLTFIYSFIWADGVSWVNTDYNTTEGTDFWLTNMFNYGNTSNDNTDLKLRIFVAARQYSQVTITYLQDNSQKTFSVNANSRYIDTLDINKCYVITERQVLEKGLHITSTTPISVYCVSQNSMAGSQDATCVLPSSALGREYVVQTYETDGISTEFTVLATQSTTSVSLTVKRKNSITQVQLPDSTINLSLSAGQVYLFRSQAAVIDLSGSTICADAPMAVFVGGQHADIPLQTTTKNHLYSQLNPVNLWGRSFVTTNSSGLFLEYIRFTSAENGNPLYKLNASNSYDTVSSDIGALGTITDSIMLLSTPFTPKAEVYKSSKLSECFLYVADYEKSQMVTNDMFQLGAPALTPITPMEYGMRSVVFTTLDAVNIQHHYVNIVTYTSTKNGMMLDGSSISASFQDIPGSPYSFCEIELNTTPVVHSIVNTYRNNVEGVFTARVYGFGKKGYNSRRESYAYSAGARVCSSAEMLIDDAYIKSKTICINQSVKFTSLINYDYTSIEWQFGDSTTSSDSIVAAKYWSEPGEYPIKMIVGRTLPPYNHTYYDTVTATINVKSTFNYSVNKLLCTGLQDTISGLNEDSIIQHVVFDHSVDTLLHFYTTNGCDSIVDVHLRFGEPNVDTITTTTCDSFEWHDSIYHESGVYQWSTTSIYGCDSAEILQLTVNYTANSPSEQIIVSTDSLPFLWNEKYYSTAGNYVDTLPTVNGCDSIVRLHLLTGNSWYSDTISDICDSDMPYLWRGKTLGQPGVYHDSLQTILGFDSIYTIRLNVYPTYNIVVDTIICQSELPYNHPDQRAFNLQNLGSTGVYTDIIPTIHGCDSVITLNLTVNPVTHSDTTVVWCQSAGAFPYGDHGKTAIESGDYSDTLQTVKNQFGCDSIVHVHLTVLKTDSIRIDTVVCQNDLPFSYTEAPGAQHLQNLWTTDVYRDTLPTSMGCDSILELHLFVADTAVTHYPLHMCENETQDWHGITLFSSSAVNDSLLIDTLQTIYGCDSIVYLHWYVHPTYHFITDSTICQYDTIEWRGKRYWDSNTYYDSFQTIHGCDSVFVLNLTVNPSYHYTKDTTICDNEVFVFHGDTLRTSDTYTKSYLTIHGCDSTFTVNLTVNPTYNIVVDTIICETELPYNHPDQRAFNLQNLDSTGVYTDIIPTIHGCDSVITLNLTVNPVTHSDTTVVWCQSAGAFPYGDHGKTAIESGDYSDTLQTVKNQFGCDSIVHVHLTVLKTDSIRIDTVVCQNDLPFSYTEAPGAQHLQNLWTTDVYRDTLPTSMGCDSILELHLFVAPTYPNELDTLDMCDNDTTTWHNMTLYGSVGTGDSIIIDTLQTIYGCDSIVHLLWRVHPTYDIVVDTIICETELPYNHPDQRASNLQNLDSTGVYTDIIPTIHGCDSVITLNLTVNPVTHSDTTVVWCQSAGAFPYGDHGKTAIESGDYSDTLQTVKNQFGCDSIVHVHLTVLKTDSIRIDTVVCQNDLPFSYTEAPGAQHLQNLWTTDVYRDTLPTSMGCDSILELHLFVAPTYPNELDTLDMCDNDTTTWHNMTLYGSVGTGDSIIIDTLQTIYGCDSIVHLLWRVHPTYVDSTIPIVLCETELPYNHPDQRASNLQNLNTTGTYTHVLKTIHGCDSVVSVQLTVLPVTHDTIITEWCKSAGPYEYGEKGKTATTSGIYVDTLITKNQYGCDSVLHVYLTVLETKTTQLFDTICSGDLPYNCIKAPTAQRLQGLTATGVYCDTIQTDKGCDSILVLHLFVPPTYPYVPETIDMCDNDTMPWHDMTLYGSVGAGDSLIIDTLQTIYGCDSIVHLLWRVHPTYVDSTIPIVLCETELPYNHPDQRASNLQNLNTTGTYTHVLKTIHGCDSVVSVQLTVLPVTHDTIITEWCKSAGPYEYGEKGKTATTSGIYVDTLITKNQYGCDSVLHLHLTILETRITTLADTICSGDLPYNYENPDAHRLQNLLATGVYRDTLQTSMGCDSILELHLFVPETYPDKHETIHMCDNETQLWNGILLDGSVGAGDSLIIDTLQTIYGCDSIVHLHWQIHPTYHFITDTTICRFDTLVWQGRRYWSTGTYFDSLQTIHGCDSVYELKLYVKPAYHYIINRTICDYDTLWFPDNVTREMVVWKPGMPMPEKGDYIRMDLVTKEGCDSSYFYYLTINPSYHEDYSDTLCSNETYQLHSTKTVGVNRLYDMYEDVAPYDTIFSDYLQTSNGCDSSFSLHAHILPQYLHTDYDTICSNEELIWRDKVLKDYAPGDTVVYDSLITQYGCDSVYCLQFHVRPSYFTEIHEVICDDESFIFNGMVIRANADTVPKLYTDSLFTQNGCDSVFHLYLKVNPTSYDTIVDTVCIGDTYDFHGVPLTDPGHYVDTTLNSYGCHHFTDLTLKMIPATEFDVSIDSICADNAEIEVYFSYRGKKPESYSVRFDSAAISQHFIDESVLIDSMDLQPADSLSGEGMIYLPVWRGEELPRPPYDYYNTTEHTYSSEPKYEYVRPDEYRLKIYFENGYCLDSSLMLVDTTFRVLYPDWIHEQHWNDAIVLYNEKYNGGYIWSDYQWYKDGAPLPGQDSVYYYNPQQLDFGHEYNILLTRADDGKSFMSCPIIPSLIEDSVTPKLEYISVVPTFVCADYPVVNILHSDECWYKIRYSSGVLAYGPIYLEKNDLNASEINLGFLFPGVYLVEMCLTNSGYRRTQKIIIQ